VLLRRLGRIADRCAAGGEALGGVTSGNKARQRYLLYRVRFCRDRPFPAGQATKADETDEIITIPNVLLLSDEQEPNAAAGAIAREHAIARNRTFGNQNTTKN